MGGVPLGVLVSTGEMETAREVLDRLLGALAALGFSGRVEDATYIGGIKRYEVEVP